METFLYTSESVNEGHPDKLCDQISDAVLDACLEQDPDSKVACETCTKTNMVMVFGEITTKAKVDYEKIVRDTCRNIGFVSDDVGLDADNCKVLVFIEQQSPDIAQGVHGHLTKRPEDIGAGDQGHMFGYATDETPELMPLSHVLATKLGARLTEVRKNGTCPWLRPDGKTQVTVEYHNDNGAMVPVRVHTVLISTQHDETVTNDEIAADLKEHVIKPVVPEKYLDEKTIFHLNPSGRFVIGGPHGDAGLTGRKIIIDTYGGWGAHGPRVDYRNAQRVYSWIRMSPAYYFQPFASALNARMSKTRSWVVALKGLMLMHGVVCCRVPAVQKVPRLPFDLSSFCDGHLPFAKSWPYNAFIRAYYAYLDQRSAFTSVDLQEREARSRLGREAPIVWDLRRLQRLQGLLDTLLEIKPQTEGRIELVVLEAMDCIVIEIYDIYSRICNGVAKVLVRICSAEKGEAAVTLKVLQKSIFQGEQLSSFFEYCKGIGVLNASECPKVERVPEEDIRELQRMIMDPPEEKAIIVSETRVDSVTGVLQTVITANWEVFDEDSAKAGAKIDSAAGALIPVPADQQRSKALNGHHHHQELPDLISF